MGGSKSGRRTPNEKIDSVVRLRSEGYSCRKIAKELNIGLQTALRICEDHGLKSCGHGMSDADRQTYTIELKKRIEALHPNFEYVGGYTNSSGRVILRCKTCGHEIERRADAVIKNTYEIRCDECYRSQCELQNSEREKKKAEKAAKRENAKRQREPIKKVCRQCGAEYITNYSKSVYCSRECARKHGNTWSDKRITKDKRIDNGINVRSLYKRDKGVCWICGQQCDLTDYTTRNGSFIAGDWYPSVDHVQAICDGGEHSWQNVRLAHRICNTRRYYDEQYRPHKFPGAQN